MKEIGLAIIVTGLIAIIVPSVYAASGVGGPFELREPDTRIPAPAFRGATGTAAAGGSGASGRPAVVSQCVACHTVSGPSGPLAPGWAGLFGKTENLEGGATVVVDDAYLRESIVSPNAKIVRGYQPNIMPQTYGTQLSEQDITAIIEYIKTLR